MGVLVDTLGTPATGAWAAGVITAVDNTEAPANSSTRGYNSALASSSLGVAFTQKRQGIRTRNRTAVSATAITGNFEYSKNSTGVRYHLLYSTNGHLDRLNDDDTTTNISTAFTAGQKYPAFEMANDLVFIVNGTDKYKFDGTTLSNFGITRPTVGSLSAAPGAAGSPSGTYELRVTYYNSVTGAESSASDTAGLTVTVTNQVLSWSNIPVSSDPQVDTVYLYVRNTDTQIQFYRAGSVTNGTTTATTDFVDANLTTPAPSLNSNNPPPDGLIDLAMHQGRMFGITARGLYWSNLNTPEAWNPLSFDGVNDSDGQDFVGIFSNQEVLLILKEDKFHTLIGPDPTTWEIVLVDSEIGCIASRTLLNAGGQTYWWSRHGLVRWNAGISVEHIGLRLYGDPNTTVEASAIAEASAAYSEAQQRIVIALPGTGQIRATFMLPFSTSASAFESNRWDPMDCASLGTAHDSTGTIQIYMGNYAGQVFRVWDTNNDGVVEGTVTGSVVATGASQTTFTDSTATFDTTGAGLLERKLTILDSAGTIITIGNRPIIVSNDATSVTVNLAVTGLVSGATYTYIIGGPDYQWDTPWRTFDKLWVKKRFEYLFMLIKGVSYGSAAKIDVAFDYDEGNANSKQRTLSVSAVAGTWDSAIWDRDVWDAPSNIEQRFRLARTGRAWRARVRNAQANQPFAMLALGVQAVTETTKN